MVFNSIDWKCQWGHIDDIRLKGIINLFNNIIKHLLHIIFWKLIVLKNGDCQYHRILNVFFCLEDLKWWVRKFSQKFNKILWSLLEKFLTRPNEIEELFVNICKITRVKIFLKVYYYAWFL